MDSHNHSSRKSIEKQVDIIEQVIHPEGRCLDCQGGKPYWRHDPARGADYHPFRAPQEPVNDATYVGTHRCWQGIDDDGEGCSPWCSDATW